MSTKSHTSSVDAKVIAHIAPDKCPTCHAEEGFQFLGEQRWPEAVARKLQMSPIVGLWNCRSCKTSITVNAAAATS